MPPALLALALLGLATGIDARGALRGAGSPKLAAGGRSGADVATVDDGSERDVWLLAQIFGVRGDRDVAAWTAKLEEHLARDPMAKVSEGHSGEPGLQAQRQQYNTLAASPSLGTVCETGFNAGHSALRFLARSNATLYEFDLGNHYYSHVSAKFLQDSFPGRLHLIWGDSTETLPQFHQAHPEVKCDLVIVDGGHTHEIAMADLVNFRQMAGAPGHSVLVIDDTPCNATSCAGPNSAWAEFKQQGCVMETQAVAIDNERGFTVGKYAPCAKLPAAV